MQESAILGPDMYKLENSDKMLLQKGAMVLTSQSEEL